VTLDVDLGSICAHEQYDRAKSNNEDDQEDCEKEVILTIISSAREPESAEH